MIDIDNIQTAVHDLTDEQLLAMRNEWNTKLETLFAQSSAAYDVAAAFVTMLELEMARRNAIGPPWTED